MCYASAIYIMVSISLPLPLSLEHSDAEAELQKQMDNSHYPSIKYFLPHTIALLTYSCWPFEIGIRQLIFPHLLLENKINQEIGKARS